MPEYLSPGVYVEEVSTRSKPIEGVGTSTAGFVGTTERGPHYPKLVTSWLDYTRWFGGALPGKSFFPHAVRGFFDNGGQRCYVARVVPDGTGVAATDVGDLKFSAIGAGSWGSRVMIRVSEGTKNSPDKELFQVSIIYYSAEIPQPFVDPLNPDNLTNPGRVEPDHVEVYDNLSTTEGASRNVLAVINSASQIVRCWWSDPTTPGVLDRVEEFAPLSPVEEVRPRPIPGDYEGSLDPIGGIRLANGATPLGQGEGLAALATVDEVAILCAPDAIPSQGLGPVRDLVITQCERLKDRFAVLSVDRGANENEQVIRDTSYAAYYYPWIEIFDSQSNSIQVVPPTGHVVGIYARTDIERGVHKAPANTVVIGAKNLEFSVPKGHQDVLNPRGVNCLRDFRGDGRGIRVWGGRTMSSDSEWRYINVRRLFLFIEESIDEGSQWVVFEPNHEPTWARVVRSVTNFLIRIWRNGALQGVTEDEAFFVKCDRTTMTQDDIDNGRLVCLIGVAPVKPAEFVIFRISQKTVEA